MLRKDRAAGICEFLSMYWSWRSMTSPLGRDCIDCYGFEFIENWLIFQFEIRKKLLQMSWAGGQKLYKYDFSSCSLQITQKWLTSVSRERDGQGGNILRVMIRNDSAACQGFHFLSSCFVTSETDIPLLFQSWFRGFVMCLLMWSSLTRRRRRWERARCQARC